MTRYLKSAPFVRIVNALLNCNTYVVAYEDGLVFVIDPGSDVDRLEAVLEGEGLVPTHVFCTHGHFDHIGGVARLAQKYGTKSVLHEADAKIARSANFFMMAYGLEGRIKTPKFDRFITGGETLFLGNDELRFEHLPGHSKGSCLIFFRDLLFSGDSIYLKGLGLPAPEQDDETLRRSLIDRWNDIGDHMLVCPGHGESGYFSDVRVNNGELLNFLGLSGGNIGG